MFLAALIWWLSGGLANQTASPTFWFPSGLSRAKHIQSVLGTDTLSAGPMDRGFGALGELLGALLATNLDPVFFEIVFLLFGSLSTTDLPSFKHKVLSYDVRGILENRPS